jgi:hypothetical protein
LIFGSVGSGSDFALYQGSFESEDIMTKSFLVGLMICAAAAWLLKDPIETRARTLRTRAAGRLRAAAEAIEGDVARAQAVEAPARITRAS